MIRFKQLKQKLRSRAVIVMASATLLGVAAVFAPGVGQQQALAQSYIQDCTDNSIIRCGASSPSDLITKIKANQPGDLPAIYNQFGLPSSSYDAFANGAKMGTAKQNGDIVVDGQVVAKNTWSIGRSHFSYSTPYTINGKTYYRSKSTDVLKQDLPVMVYMDSQGRMQSAVLQACGNPMGGDRVTTTAPTYSCRQLRSVRATNANGSVTCGNLSGSTTTGTTTNATVTTNNGTTVTTTNTNGSTTTNDANATYCFSTDAPATTGATVTRVVYDFGDGTQETRTNPDDVVTHNYSQSGTFTAKVTVYIRLADGREVTANAAGACSRTITVSKPVQTTQVSAAWRCTSLTVSRAINNGSGTTSVFNTTTTSGGTDNNADTNVVANTNYLTYTFRANTSYSNARLVSADFDYGDGNTDNAVQAAGDSSNSISHDHTYAQPGTYTARAMVHFEPNDNATATTGKEANDTCEHTFTINQPATTTTVTTPPQKTLPNTGPAGIAGLFGGASAAGMMGYRWRARRRLDRVDQLMDSIHRS